MQFYQPVTTIYLYDEPGTPGLNIAEVGGYLLSTFPAVQIVPRTDFLTHHFGRFDDEQRAQLEQVMLGRLAEARLEDLEAETGNASSEASGLVVDAAAYQAILRLLVDPSETGADRLHIAFTDMAIGSRRGRVDPVTRHIICLGEPAVISTTGFVDALPRPREYQFKRAQFAMLGVDDSGLENLADGFADRTFDHGDPRINEVCEGYALMACFYRTFGEAFCSDPSCRLYAARDQEELLETQCSGGDLCGHHDAMAELVDQEPPPTSI